MAALRCAQLRVTGRVQAVGYRAWAIREAGGLGLRGWVRNRADGSVEALVIGEDAAVVAMIVACRRGPWSAVVSDVAVADVEDDGSIGFAQLPTR